MFLARGPFLEAENAFHSSVARTGTAGPGLRRELHSVPPRVASILGEGEEHRGFGGLGSLPRSLSVRPWDCNGPNRLGCHRVPFEADGLPGPGALEGIGCGGGYGSRQTFSS